METVAKYVAIIVLLALGFKSYEGEHAARLKAEAAVASAQTQIVSLQQQISNRDKALASATAPIIKIIHDVKTVPQAVAALPQVVTAPLPLPVVAQPDNTVIIPAPDIIPLFDQVADDKLCRQLFTGSQADLADTKAIVTQQQAEITALKKKPAFWTRVKSTAIKVGIGVAIGVAIAVKL